MLNAIFRGVVKEFPPVSALYSTPGGVKALTDLGTTHIPYPAATICIADIIRSVVAAMLGSNPLASQAFSNK